MCKIFKNFISILFILEKLNFFYLSKGDLFQKKYPRVYLIIYLVIKSFPDKIN